MDRLTTRIAGEAAMAPEHEEKHTIPEWIDMLHERLAAYEDTGLMPEEIGNAVSELAWVKGQLDNIVKQFGLYHDGMGDAILELLKMSKEGRLLPLPCPIGSTVYVIGHQYRAGRDECWINKGKFRPSDLEKIGERVFLSYEDAKAKILDMNKGNSRLYFEGRYWQ